MEQYPLPNDIDKWKAEVVRMRESDVADFDNLYKQFMQIGSGVTRSSRTTAPTSSTNVSTTDNDGDFYAVPGFLYILVNNSGTLKWQRTALSDF